MHFVWAGEKIKSTYLLAAPDIEQSSILPTGLCVVKWLDLMAMKPQAGRDHDRVHLRDMVDVGLIGREMLVQLPPELVAKLAQLLNEAGR